MTIDDLKKNAISDSHPSGFIIVDGVEVAQTKQCCHCGRHFVSVKGSGAIRGRCSLCPLNQRITCGAPGCDVHIPVEAKLDFLDGGNGLKSSKWDHSIAEQMKKLDGRIL